MKKNSLKFRIFFILCLFSSFAFADGVFSKYYGSNGNIGFSVNVPITEYEQPTPDGSEIIDLQFLKNSNVIPSKNFFKAIGAMNNDGINIKSKNKDINFGIYISNYPFPYTEDSEEQDVRDSFEKDNLNYNKFIKKYYNGKSPKNFNSLKFNYNIILFKNQENIAYSTIGKDFYVVSYIENNKIIYQKVMFKEDAYIVFYASYLAKDKNFMDKIVTEMANSIKFLK
ncbi:hypothetical protein [Fusobacterium polymorphum]|uniref:hypothetical protein n=1 Tax=Fusobacterium nucleatum subsp. polymorphum TaxID=76857 RepID=UPI00300BAD87